MAMPGDRTDADVAVFPLELSSLRIAPARVAAAMGYPDGAAPEPFLRRIEQAIEAAPEHADVRAGYRLFPEGALALGAEGFRLEGVGFRSERIITRGLAGCTALAIFAATAGRPFDAWIRAQFDRNDLVTGFLIDSLGSEIAEAAADRVEARIVEEARARGLGGTNRFSPGYCRWPVQDQHRLFAFLPDGFAGITLTESSLMVPVKSVSGVIGLGPGVRRRAYPCRACDVEDCFRRPDPGAGGRP